MVGMEELAEQYRNQRNEAEDLVALLRAEIACLHRLLGHEAVATEPQGDNAGVEPCEEGGKMGELLAIAA